MADVPGKFYRATKVRTGVAPSSAGSIEGEPLTPVNPPGSSLNSVGLTMPSAFTVSNSPLTANGTIGVAGAGTVGQYIRGDGSLADFPQASGGGSSVSYYLNGSISQGTIGGVAYKELNKVPILGAGTDFTINADGYIASFLTDAGDPNLLEIAGGNWNFETYFSASSSGGTPSFYVELYKYDGTTFTLIASSSTSPELIAFGTNLNPYFSTLAVPTTTLALTDRLAVRFYVNHSGRTITLHTENNHLCQVVTTFTTGLTSLNGLTAQVQNLAVGTSGTDFNIASATATHTFNLPTASATNRGALSSADWTTFNNKQNALGYVPVPETRTITINGVSQDLSANRTYNVGTVTSVGLSSATSGVTIGGSPVTGVGAFTLAIATASGSQNGLLSSTDWTTFNSKQNALTNPVTGTGASGQIAYFNGTTSITSENTLFWDSTNDRLGIGTNIPAHKLVVEGTVPRILAKDVLGAIAQMLAINNSEVAFGSQTNHPIRILINDADVARINTNGNFLIGSPPAADNGARLQVSGAVTTMATITSSGTASGLQLTNTSGTASSWIIQSDGGAVAGQAALRFYSITASAYRMSIDGSGNVGIGTPSPVKTLDVRGTLAISNSALSFWYMDRDDTDGRFKIVDDSNNDRFNITTNGNVGIGTTNPTERFEVAGLNGNIRLYGRSGISNNSISSNLYYNGSAWVRDNASFGAAEINFGSSNDTIIFSTNSATSGSVTERMRITSIGNVVIQNNKIYGSGEYLGAIWNSNGGNTTWTIGDTPANQTSWNLRVNTSAAKSGGGSWGDSSDGRLKKDIKTIENALDKINKLNPVTFEWINPSEHNNQYNIGGFIAQEIKEIFPQFVNQINAEGKDKDIVGINEKVYGLTLPFKFDAYIVKSIQELYEQIQELKQEIYTLKN